MVKLGSRTCNTRQKENKRNVEHCEIGSNIANYARTNNHKINLDNGKIIEKRNYHQRRVLIS